MHYLSWLDSCILLISTFGQLLKFESKQTQNNAGGRRGGGGGERAEMTIKMQLLTTLVLASYILAVKLNIKSELLGRKLLNYYGGCRC